MNKTAKSVMILMVAMILSKFLGFSRDLFLAYFYGNNTFTDSYIFAFMLPSVMFGSLGMAMLTIFMPLYSKIKGESGKAHAESFMNNTLNTTIMITLVISIIISVFSKQTISLMGGMDEEALELCAYFGRVVFPGLIFIMLQYVFMAYLQLNENFAVPALTGIPFNMILIIAIAASSMLSNPNILRYGSLLSFVGIVMMEVIFVRRYGYKYEFKIDFKDKNLRSLFKNLIPAFIGLSVLQISTYVDRAMATSLAPGSISSLNYANRLNEFIFGIFALSIITVIYPQMTEMAGKKDYESLRRVVKKAINMISILIIPICIGILVLSRPLVSFLFERGNFDASASMITSRAFFYYALSIFGFSMMDMLSKVFYSMNKQRVPLINGIFAIGLNFVLNIAFMKTIGFKGIPIATSIASLVGALNLYIILKKEIGIKYTPKLAMNVSKIALCASLMGAGVMISHNILSPAMAKMISSGFIAKGISIGVSVVAGIIIYFAFVVLFKVDEINEVIAIIKSKIMKKSKS